MNIYTLPRTPCRPSDPVSYLFFAPSDPLYRYRSDPLPDFRRTPGGWGVGFPPSPTRHLCAPFWKIAAGGPGVKKKKGGEESEKEKGRKRKKGKEKRAGENEEY